MMDNIEFESTVLEHIETILGVTRSDAQGILDAQQSYFDDLRLREEMTAEQVAQRISAAGSEIPTRSEAGAILSVVGRFMQDGLDFEAVCGPFRDGLSDDAIIEQLGERGIEEIRARELLEFEPQVFVQAERPGNGMRG